MTAPLVIEVEVFGLPVEVEVQSTSAIVSPGPPVAVLVAVPGPRGVPGLSAAGSAPYKWKTNTAATDPTHGFVKANNSVDTALLTEIYVSVYDQNEQALLALVTLTTGSLIYLYEAGELDTWNQYQLIAPPTLHDSPAQWATLPVEYVATGAAAFTPGVNTDILLVTPAVGEPGPPGEGVVVMGEIPAGVLNGLNTVFTTVNEFLPDSTGIYLNGLRLVRGPHYAETTSQSVTLGEAPSSVDTLTIDYTVAG